jgi:chemotaxis regulatin CheY-phosphate phosphatase CheZ
MSGTDKLQIRLQKEVSELSTSIATLLDGFNKLRNPIVESRQKVPQATNQLDKISEQTEAAAHRMLDMVEKITEREGDIISSLGQFKEYAQSNQPDNILSEIDGVIEKANVNLNDAFMIMDALQFQDITSQQMDHAATLLEEVEGKLHGILADLGTNDNDSVRTASEKKKVRAFDPHADFSDKQTNQQEIDNMFDHTEGKQEVDCSTNVK